MAIAVLFFFGIGNFAMHKAVLESRHAMLGHMPWFNLLGGGRFGLGVEFLVLLGSMLMVSQGALGWAWGYGFYTFANAAAAWLILSDRA
ncbi:MAG: hypothetical protein JWQ16_2194 [Novosphingobium sp.]|jgi:hypothetical protein|nr:hypothetical protein [Novosphingobium sp.]